MSGDIFKFQAATVPKAVRGIRRSKYVSTVEAVHEYLRNHKDEQSVKIELGDASLKSAISSFRNAISKLHPDSLRLVQRAGELYIQRR